MTSERDYTSSKKAKLVTSDNQKYKLNEATSPAFTKEFYHRLGENSAPKESRNPVERTRRGMTPKIPPLIASLRGSVKKLQESLEEIYDDDEFDFDPVYLKIRELEKAIQEQEKQIE